MDRSTTGFLDVFAMMAPQKRSAKKKRYARHTHVRMSIGDRRDAAEKGIKGRPWKGVNRDTPLLIPLHDLWRHYLEASDKTGNTRS